jgi:translation initiation factor 3 subunit D
MTSSSSLSWGPPISAGAEATSLPFSIFNKADKLGKVADFLSQHARHGIRAAKSEAERTTSTFAYAHEAEDASFKEVETKSAARARADVANGTQSSGGASGQGQSGSSFTQASGRRGYGRGGARGGYGYGAGSQGGQNQSGGFRSGRGGYGGPGGPGGPGARGSRFGAGRGGMQAPRFDEEVLEPSIAVDRAWPRESVFEFSDLAKRTLELKTPGRDVHRAGRLRMFDVRMGDVTPKEPKLLASSENVAFFSHVPASQDPVLQDLVAQHASSNKKHLLVVSTDTAFTALACSPRAVFSFDVVVRRGKNSLIFDTRDGAGLELQSVNENDSFPPTNEHRESLNCQEALAIEATYASQAFSQQALSTADAPVDEPNPTPFGTAQNAADIGYVYRSFELPDGTEVVVRCEVHGLVRERNEVRPTIVKALLEYETPSKWTTELTKQRGGVLLAATQRNLFQMMRWATAAHMVEAPTMKVGFVTRVVRAQAGPGSSSGSPQMVTTGHRILGVDSVKPDTIRAAADSWGVISALVTKCKSLSEGTYLLFKPPAKPRLELYVLPDGAFERYDDDDDNVDED